MDTFLKCLVCSTSLPFAQGRLHSEQSGGTQSSKTLTSLLVLNSVVSVHVTSTCTSFCSGLGLSLTLQITLIYAPCTFSTSASRGTLQHGITYTCVLFKTQRKISVNWSRIFFTLRTLLQLYVVSSHAELDTPMYISSCFCFLLPIGNIVCLCTGVCILFFCKILCYNILREDIKKE